MEGSYTDRRLASWGHGVSREGTGLDPRFFTYENAEINVDVKMHVCKYIYIHIINIHVRAHIYILRGPEISN